jgi:hypothetical protein
MFDQTIRRLFYETTGSHRSNYITISVFHGGIRLQHLPLGGDRGHYLWELKLCPCPARRSIIYL